MPNCYICTLEDVDHGYSGVSILAMLTHLKTTYANIEPKEIESNRNALTNVGNPDVPIEELWHHSHIIPVCLEGSHNTTRGHYATGTVSKLG